MTTLTIPDVPDEVVRALEARAAANQRSLADEARDVLAEASARDEAALLERIRSRREAMRAQGVWLTPEDIEQAINEGRP